MTETVDGQRSGAMFARSGASEQAGLDQLCVNTIRTLSMDAVQQANSGHPGTPMATAPIAYCLWQRFLRFDPEHPIWPNRDRFVLSANSVGMAIGGRWLGEPLGEDEVRAAKRSYGWPEDAHFLVPDGARAAELVP
jgi:transketolase